MQTTKSKFCARDIERIHVNETIWDHEISGLHVRRQLGSDVTFILQYRNADAQRRYITLGKYGDKVIHPDGRTGEVTLNHEVARRLAERSKAEIHAGNDPQAIKQQRLSAPTLSEFCDEYLIACKNGDVLVRGKGEPKKLSTITSDKTRIENHIKPLIGHLKVSAITKDDLEKAMQDIKNGKTAGLAKNATKRLRAKTTGGRGTATRTIRLLGGIFSYAIKRKLRTDNPAWGFEKYKDGIDNRILHDDEYPKLAKALKSAEDTLYPAALAFIKFILFSGWRPDEAMQLCKQDVDFNRCIAHLTDSKAGEQYRVLSTKALQILADEHPSEQHSLFFPATRGSNHPMTGYKWFMSQLRKLGDLPDAVTAKTFRKSFVSVGTECGYSDLMCGALIGHTNGKTVTSRNYIFFKDRALIECANKICERITDYLEGRVQSTPELTVHTNAIANPLTNTNSNSNTVTNTAA